MKYEHLKKIRVVISLIVITLVTLSFVDFSGYSAENISGKVLFLQFIPSFLQFLTIGGVISSGFIIVIIFTLVIGRVYCSSICPLGILQDVFTWFATRTKKKKRRYKSEKPYNKLRYSILVISVILFFAGSILAFSLLDPYSNFGRIAANVFYPVVVFTNNIVSYIFELLGNYSVYPLELRKTGIAILLFSITVLGIIFYMSFRYGRLFCNTVCPVGSFLGLLSKFALFKIKIDEDNCRNCGACEKICKSNCIDSETKEVDFTRCVNCFNCFQVCPTDGLKYTYKFSYLRKKEKETDNSKREFFINSAFFLTAFTTISKADEKIKVYVENKIKPEKHFPIAPPGAGNIEHFNDRCTACHLCVSACPTQVLQPSFLEYGLSGMLQPRMNNKKGFCNFECNVCSEVCPNGAIMPITLEKKKVTQIGIAKFIHDNCVVVTEGTDCGACSEHCPTKAVKMVPEGKLRIPKVTGNICIGCGACEYACPTIPNKAIYVDGNPVHKKALLPKSDSEEQKVNIKEDFPF